MFASGWWPAFAGWDSLPTGSLYCVSESCFLFDYMLFLTFWVYLTRLQLLTHPVKGIGRLVARHQSSTNPSRRKTATGVHAAMGGDILDPWPRARKTLLDENKPMNRNGPPAIPPSAPRRENAIQSGLATNTTANTFHGNANRYHIWVLNSARFASGKSPFSL